MNPSISINLSPQWIAVALVGISMAIAAWAYATRYDALGPRRRGLLLAARLAALAGLLIAALSPVLSVPAGGKARNRLLVLVDHSGSMTVRDAGGRSRRDAADSAAAAVARTFGRRYDVRVAAFGAKLGPFVRGGAPSTVGAGSQSETALGDAVRSALERNDPDSVAALLIVSDGVVNRGEDPDRALGGAVPAYALWTGAAEDPPSVSLAGVDVPAEAVAGHPAPIAVRLRQGKRPATQGTVRLMEDGVERARARYSLATPGASTALSLPYTPSSPGVHFLEIAVDGSKDDPLEANKQRIVAVHARASTRRLAILAAQWDWDLRSLARGATEDTSWSVSRYRPGPGGDVVALDGGTRISFEEMLRRSAAIAIRYESRTLPPERASTLLRFLERGSGALLWIDPNGQPPPETALTRAVGFVWRQWSDPPGVAASVELAPAGRTSEIALLGGDAASAGTVWGAMPPVAPILPIGAGPTLTPVLLGRVDESRTPILLTGRVGAGRVAVLNAMGVYRWGLTAGGLSTGGSSGIEGPFFGGLCRWLESSGSDRAVRIEAPDVNAEGAGVPIRIVSADAVPGTTARVVTRPEGKGGATETTLTASADGAFTGTLNLPAGIHRLRASLERGGRVVGRDSIRVAVGEGGLEYEALAAEPGTLERLASGSGGIAAPLASPDRVLERLRRPDAARARMAEIDLFHNPVLFALLIAALTAEWALRKRFHLL